MDITLVGETFALQEKAPGGLILKIAEAEQAGDLGKAMALTLRMLRLLVIDEDRERFDAFVESEAFDRLELDDIQKALEGAAQAVVKRPTKRSGSLPPGPPPTTATPKVVRLSQGTTPARSSGGTSQAS